VIRDIIAKRYAKAFFAFASEHGVLDQATEEVREFAALLAEHKDLHNVLSNPVYEIAERKAVLAAVLAKLDISEGVKAFLLVLTEKNKMKYLGAIVTHLDLMVDVAEGRLHVDVVSAVPLDDATVAQLKQKLTELTRKDVQLSIKVDESLIGGLVTRFAGMVYDGSIRTQLNNLGENLIKEW
jgi:F-type H+-transporting ATPase subunit delta